MRLRFSGWSAPGWQLKNFYQTDHIAQWQSQNIAGQNIGAAPCDPCAIAADVPFFDQAVCRAACPNETQEAQQPVNPHESPPSNQTGQRRKGIAFAWGGGLRAFLLAARGAPIPPVWPGRAKNALCQWAGTLHTESGHAQQAVNIAFLQPDRNR